MKQLILIAALATTALTASAQGNNTGQGGPDGNYTSLAKRVANLEKKSDAFNVYLNYSGSFNESKVDDADWTSKFATKQLRLEIKGDIGEHLSYRLRHRLNRSNAAKGEDNFAKATDIMSFTWKFSDKFSLTAGKHCQYWGGFEFDENPMHIYQFSDMVNEMDNYHAGIVASWKPVPSQELVVDITNTSNGQLAEDYGDGAVSAEGDGTQIRVLEQANHPLTAIVNWNGSLFRGLITTRWSWGIQTQAKQKYSRELVLGQQLNLPGVEWYLDYYGTWDALDRLRIVSGEVNLPGYASDVHHNSFVTKARFDLADRWKLMVKGMYETASVSKVEKYKDYRKAWGYVGALEYYPVQDQDIRLFLSYTGRKYNYTEKCGLKDYDTHRIELGFMYRIKAF